MVSHVALRITNVEMQEINNLNSEICTVNNLSYHDDIIEKEQGINDYIVTVSPADLQKVKDTLRVILKVVESERVAIET